MIITVKSSAPVSEAEQEKIRGILRESKCQNESLRDTLPSRYRSMTGSEILLDDGDRAISTAIEY